MSYLDRVVSQHAVLRWLERRRGMDMDSVRAEMITHEHPISEDELATYLRSWHRVNFTEIRREIYTKAVKILIKLKAECIPLVGEHHGYTLRVKYNGDDGPVITTVLYSEDSKKAPKKSFKERVARRNR